ncbi:unnamed protein product [Oikopleura dioica]|uniref:Uncharacterized protein n=1 Tax=Oikopleura dioica TaxID=34765 RepID=E4XB35_OIKDI|nr:unnamed protein product [Oikopleura dioica]CBY37695.1 unnamed protein product [Oikopleura dioica]
MPKPRFTRKTNKITGRRVSVGPSFFLSGLQKFTRARLRYFISSSNSSSLRSIERVRPLVNQIQPQFFDESDGFYYSEQDGIYYDLDNPVNYIIVWEVSDIGSALVADATLAVKSDVDRYVEQQQADELAAAQQLLNLVLGERAVHDAAEIWKTQTRPREYSVDEVRDEIYQIVLLELEGVF